MTHSSRNSLVADVLDELAKLHVQWSDGHDRRTYAELLHDGAQALRSTPERAVRPATEDHPYDETVAGGLELYTWATDEAPKRAPEAEAVIQTLRYLVAAYKAGRVKPGGT